MSNFYGFFLKLLGWSVEITVPYRTKSVICVAPHTSNWDFIFGILAYKSMGREAKFLMKKFWFFFPLKYILKRIGGIPVDRKSNHSLTSTIVEDFNKYPSLNLAVTPEGTRKPVNEWKTGFLRIATNAQVVIQLGVIDYTTKSIIIKNEYYPTGDIQNDLLNIRKYYSHFVDAAKFPNKFIP